MSVEICRILQKNGARDKSGKERDAYGTVI